MRIRGGNYVFDPQRSYDVSSDVDRLSGITIHVGQDYVKEHGSFNVRLNVETPNALYFTLNQLKKEVEECDLVYHLCPYTTEYLNKKYNTNKVKTIFFPIQLYECEENERNIPVIFTGHRATDLDIYLPIENEIKKRTSSFDHICKAISNGDGFYKKLNFLAQSKIAIVYSILAKTNKVVSYNPDFDPEYKHIFPWHSSDIHVPQIKSRIFEGAMMGCVLLVYKDETCIHEKYFNENEDFVYFENAEDLSKKIDLILTNYDDYIPIAKRAQKKMKEKYTLKGFIDTILKDKKELTN